MRKEKLTLSRVRDALAMIAEEHPEAAGSNEKYDLFNGDGTPRDIAGHVLALCGITVGETYRRCCEDHDENIRVCSVDAMSDEQVLKLGITPPAFSVLVSISHECDDGRAWKEIHERYGHGT